VADALASLQIFLTIIFLALVWARGAAMAFDGGGAFVPKRTMGAIGENWKVEPSSFLGSGPSSCCRKRKWNQRRNQAKSGGKH
jgi:hypothetical protein